MVMMATMMMKVVGIAMMMMVVEKCRCGRGENNGHFVAMVGLVVNSFCDGSECEIGD